MSYSPDHPSAEATPEAPQRNLFAFLSYLENAPNARFHRYDVGVIRWNAPLSHPWFQGLLSSRPRTEKDDRLLKDAVEYFEEAGAAGFSWWIEPEARGHGWEELLQENGFKHDENTPGMLVDIASIPESASHVPGLDIRIVEDSDDLEIWAKTVATGFGMGSAAADLAQTMEGLPLDLPTRNYFGLVDGEVQAASSLFLGAGVAGIYNVATLEAARGRGLGAAMTAKPLLDAAGVGYSIGVLQSSQMGYRVYERLGFRHVCQIGNFYRALGKAAG